MEALRNDSYAGLAEDFIGANDGINGMESGVIAKDMV
jgi:hypothetical protein